MTKEHKAEVREGVLYMLPGYDLAIIGICTTWDSGALVRRLVYDGPQLMKTMMDSDGSTRDEAEDYIAFNMEAVYVGEGTPIIVWPWDGEHV